MGIVTQVICTIAACYLCMSIGVIFAWPSCTMKDFESKENTTLHRAMSQTELALFGSLSSIGALISTPFTGYMLDIVGRKSCIIVASLTQVIAWTMIAASNQVEVVLAAVFVSGVGGSGFLAVPMFTSEICQESIRGSMTAGMMIFYAVGMLLSYVLGGLLQYHMMVYVCLSMCVFGVGLLSIVKETPLYYMKKGMEEEAAQSFAFYRRAAVDSKVVLEEMNALRRAFNPITEDDELTPEEEQLKPKVKDTEHQEKEKLSLFAFIKKSQSTRRAIVVSLILMTTSLFQGLVVVQVYAEPLFIEAVPNMSPTVCSVLLAIITVVFGFIGAYLTDIIGRRPLIIHSSMAAMLCCVVLGSQLQLHWAPHWVTAVAIYMFTITYTLGGGTVPYVFTAEIFLPEVKSFMTMMVVEWAWFCNFVILFIFSPLESAIGLGPVFYLFAAVCLFTSIYSLLCVPETNGLPVDAIQGLFLKRKRAQKY